MDHVIFDDVVVAGVRDRLMRGIVDLVMAAHCAHTVQAHRRLVSPVYLRPVIDQIVGHDIFTRCECLAVAAREDHTRLAGGRDRIVFDEDTLARQLYGIFPDIFDGAVLDRDVAARSPDRACARAGKGDKGCTETRCCIDKFPGLKYNRYMKNRGSAAAAAPIFIPDRRL